jgi:conjugal transfer pilus assembly protein TraK
MDRGEQKMKMSIHYKLRPLFAAIVFASSVGLTWADAASPDASPSTVRAAQHGTKETPAKKEWNSTEVNPNTAVKDSAQREIVLPGVMKIQGANANALDFTRARTIQLTNGGSVSVYLSSTEPNRIQLPFQNPHIIGTTDITVDKRANSNNVYIGFKQGVTRATQVFFETPDGAGPVLGLQLVPKGIPAQTIIVEDVASRTTPEQAKANKSSEYITAMQSLMETVAFGGTPNGYSTVELKVAPIAMGGLMVEVEKKLSNREADIYIYRITNPGPATAYVRESDFDGDLVQAVSVYPKPSLRANESNKVIVIARKEKAQ